MPCDFAIPKSRDTRRLVERLCGFGYTSYSFDDHNYQLQHFSVAQDLTPLSAVMSRASPAALRRIPSFSSRDG